MADNSFGGSVTGTVSEFSKTSDVGSGSIVDQTDKKKSSTKKTKQNREENIGAKVLPRHAFGSTALPLDGIQGFSAPNGDKESNDRLIYRVGRQLCVFDPENGRQQFLNGRSKAVLDVLHFSISHNARFLCVCETIRANRSDPGHNQASIYSLASFNRQKTLIHSSAVEFYCSAFCGDSKYLVTLSEDPERMLILWQWEKERLLKSVTLTFKVTKMTTSPTSIFITTSGPGFLKFWFIGPDSNLKMGSLLPPAKEMENFVDHAWLPTPDARRMIALTDAETPEGQVRRQGVYVFEGLETLAASSAIPGHGSLTPPIAMELKQHLHLKLASNIRITRVVPYSKGFILVGTGGYMSFMERTEDKKEPFVEFRSVTLGKEALLSGATLPTEEKIAVLAESGRLISVSLAALETLSQSTSEPASESLASDLTFGGMHHKAVLASDIAQQRPVLVTIANDHTARLWNFESLKCELVHDFRTDEPTAISMAYSGFQILVAFKERVRLYNVLLDKFKVFKESVIKGCKDLKFSSGGHLWAAASTINVMVFDSKTFQQLVSFQGHMMAVKHLAWGPGDQVLFSAGAEGNVYGWSLLSDQRLDVIASSGRSAGILGLTIDGDAAAIMRALSGGSEKAKSGRGEEEVEAAEKALGNSTIVSLKDGTVRIADWALAADSKARDSVGNARIVTVSADGSEYISVLQMSADRQFVFTGTNTGVLRIYTWPMTDESPYLETLVHSSPIVDVRESPTGNAVITVAEDGSIFVHALFKGTNAAFATVADMAEASGGDGDGQYNSDVLMVAAEDIEEHVHEVVELQKRIEDGSTKYAFETHQRESTHVDEMRRQMEGYESELASERERYEQLQAESDRRIRELRTSMEAQNIDHMKATSELENRYEHKLASQLERYDRLSEDMEMLRQKCDGLLLAERLEYEKELADLKADGRLREKRMRQENKRIRDDRANDENAFKEVLDQQEDEYEDELKQLIAAAETELKNERENIAKMRTLVQTKNTKLDQTKKKLIELSMTTKQHQEALTNERREKKKLLETIDHYKKNLSEREETLAEKEKIILDLRSSTRTLDNFKFVLENRLQQLMCERGPITRHIEGLEHHIRTMYEELVDEFDAKKESKMQTEFKDMKLSGLHQEVEHLRQQTRQKDLYIAAFKRELGNAVVASGGPKEMENNVRALYRKYVRGEVTGKEDPSPAASSKTVSGTQTAKLPKEDGGADMLATRVAAEAPSGLESDISKRERDLDLEDAAKEAERQKYFAERQAQNLEHRLKSTKAEAIRINNSRLKENSQLVFECNELRRQLKLTARDLDATKQREAEALRALASLKGGNTAMARQSNANQSRSAYSRGSEGPDREGDYDEDDPEGGYMDKAASYHEVMEPSEDGSSSREPTRARGFGSNKNALSGRPFSDSSKLMDDSSVSVSQQLSGAAKAIANDSLKAQSLGSRELKSKLVRDDRAEAAGSDLEPQLPMSIAGLRPAKVLTAGKRIANSLLAASSASELPKTIKLHMEMPRILSKDDFTVQRLGDDVAHLTAQLDESAREKAIQQAEIAKLRADLLKQQITNNRQKMHQKLPSPLKVKQPNLVRKYILDSGNSQQAERGADADGRPTSSDLKDLELGPSRQKAKRGSGRKQVMDPMVDDLDGLDHAEGSYLS